MIPYKAGKPIDEVRRELGLKNIIKLASNETPFVSGKVKAAIKNNLYQINRYPEGSCFYLKRSLAKKLKLNPRNLLFGNGSDEIIDIIIKTFMEKDEEVLTSKTTFLEYEIVACANGRRVKTAPLKNFKYDLAAIKKRVNRKTKVIFIANPNNPTGTYVNNKEVEGFLRGLPEKIIVVFDEAYNEFVTEKDFPCIEKYLKKKNIIILRTFSKVYGLAGLRIGYSMAKPKFISFMERVRPPFNVNSLAQVAALASLSDRQHVIKVRNLILNQKKYLYNRLERMGISYVPTAANFILVNVRRNTVSVFKDMLRYGVIVRDLSQYGLNNFIRVTIGTQRENERFIRVLKKVL